MNALRRISDLSKPLKDERPGHKNHHISSRVKVGQNLSKHLKARQMCVDDDERKCNNAQNTQHK